MAQPLAQCGSSVRSLIGWTLIAMAIYLTGQPVSASARNTLWIHDKAPSEQAVQLIGTIVQSLQHGLKPARYGINAIETDLAALTSTDRQSALVSLSDRLDAAFLQLVNDLGRGMVDGQQVQARLYRAAPQVDAEALLESVRSGHMSVPDALHSVTPQHHHYQSLLTHMQSLLEEKARADKAAGRGQPYSDAYRPVIQRTDELQPGAWHADVMAVKKRLVQTRDLSADTVLTPRFDAPLLVAVQAFQARHGLAISRAIDAPTLAELNRSVEDDINAAALSLERLRWMPREFGHRHLLVNLPDFRVRMWNGEQQIVDMRVVVGATQHKTPVFSETLKYIEFNPTWTVPRSIALNKLIPRERREPGYLAENNYQYKRWEENRLVHVPDEEVPEFAAHLRPFPFVLQQQPGEGNALGRMKFMMPNPYAIYLHDTPAQSLFGERVRAHSHGCIRLSDPDRLASLLLQIDGHNPDSARWLAGRRYNNRVHFDTPVPVHLAYYTTWIDTDGRLQTRPDIYEYNDRLQAAMEAADTALAALPADSAG